MTRSGYGRRVDKTKSMRRLPAIKELISTLVYQVAVGKAHLVIAKGLPKADSVVLAAARTFFAMSIDAHLYTSLMYAARLHDNQRNAITVRTLLERAGKEPKSAPFGTSSEVRAAIASSDCILSNLIDPLKRLVDRRNRRLAHTDPRTIVNPTHAIQTANEDFDDLNAIFQGTGTIVNEFSRLYRDVTAILDIVDETDYESVIQFVFEAKCKQVRDYEKEFGVPAPFARPKGCQ
jgi:AbiU2